MARPFQDQFRSASSHVVAMLAGVSTEQMMRYRRDVLRYLERIQLRTASRTPSQPVVALWGQAALPL
jgi:hypothetical protein